MNRIRGKSIALKAEDDLTFASKSSIDADSICYVGVTCANEKKYDTHYSITIA